VAPPLSLSPLSLPPPGELDDGPDWTEPEAWSAAADFIVQVHQQLPSDLQREARAAVAVSQLMIDKVVEQLPSMPCMGTRQ
jgi:hypothetical protein